MLLKMVFDESSPKDYTLMTESNFEEMKKVAVSGDEIVEQHVIQKFQHCIEELKQQSREQQSFGYSILNTLIS